MTESGDRTRRGPRLVAVLAVLWIGMGFESVEDGRMWHAAAHVSLGLLLGATYFWPGSAPARFVDRPIVRRKRPADR